MSPHEKPLAATAGLGANSVNAADVIVRMAASRAVRESMAPSEVWCVLTSPTTKRTVSNPACKPCRYEIMDKVGQE